MNPAARRTRTPRWLTALPWALWALAMLGLAAIPWFDHLLRAAGRPDLAQLNATSVPPVLAVVSAITVGAVLASRRPATRWAGYCWAWGCQSRPAGRPMDTPSMGS